MLSQINALKLRVTLRDITPPIWREIIVPIDWTLRELHLGLQAAFGWTDSHLHEFNVGGLRFGEPDVLLEGAFDDSPNVFDETSVRLRDFQLPGMLLTYVYDFGDHWQHDIVLQEPLGLEVPPKTALCTAGARARPPEDVGGTSGYDAFLAILADPNDPERPATLRWSGGHFDPEWFDLDRINKDLRNTLRSNARRPLHQPRPGKN